MYDYRQANLDPQTRGMLDYATKLTQDPASMSEADIVKLRELGLSDEQILSVVLITCEYNFMTRLADGLGVEVSPQREEYVKQWIAGPAAEQEWLFRRKG